MQKMKHQLLILLAISIFNIGYTETSVDYDEINERAKEAKKKGKFKKFMKEFAYRTGIDDVFSTNFPASRKLTNIEKLYKPLIRCTRKIAKRKKGGIEGPTVIATIFESVYVDDRLVEDSYLIENATQECRKSLRALKKYSYYQNEMEKKLETIETLEPIKEYLKSLYTPGYVTCESRDIKASAFFAIGGTNYMVLDILSSLLLLELNLLVMTKATALVSKIKLLESKL
jgi:hypothetical protein